MGEARARRELIMGVAGLLGLAPPGAQSQGTLARPDLGRPAAPVGEGAVYEDRRVGGYQFQGTLAGGEPPGGRPAGDGREGGRSPGFHRYRILRSTATGTASVREIGAADLARARGQAREEAPAPCSGLFFLAFNPDRAEVYLTAVVDAARIVTREVFAVPLGDGEIRPLGSFSTAGEALTAVRFSPSGDYLTWMALWGSKVLQGLTVVRVGAEGIREWPADREVLDFCGKFPAWALEITDYRWHGDHQLVFRQRIAPSPELPGAGRKLPAPAGQDRVLRRGVDVQDGRTLWETWE